MHAAIKEAQDSYINLSPDHINHFDRIEKLLLDKKMINFEKLLNTSLEAGKFVKNLMQTIDAYKTKSFQYSYANVSRKKASNTGQDNTKHKVEKFILTDAQKRDKLVDSIFAEMRQNKKIPSYYQNSIPRIEKLKLIRDHFQNLYAS